MFTHSQRRGLRLVALAILAIAIVAWGTAPAASASAYGSGGGVGKGMQLGSPFKNDPNNLIGRQHLSQGPVSLTPSPVPWGQYHCCYTGKGHDVLFIHGVAGNGINGADRVDCDDPPPLGHSFGNMWYNSQGLLFNNNQWPGHMVFLQYYNHDQNCNANINQSAHYYSKCNGYPDGTGQPIGNNNEPDEHLACALAWYIWDHYTVNSYTLDIVTHSLGGVLLKYALYKISQGDSHFPAYLFVNRVVVITGPLDGAPPLLSAHIVCGGCDEIAAIQAPALLEGDIYAELNNNRLEQGLGGTSWAMLGNSESDIPEGQACDPTGDSVFGIDLGSSFNTTGYWNKVDYRFNVPNISTLDNGQQLQGACYHTDPDGNLAWQYGHGTYLQDNQTANEVTVYACNSCQGDPSTREYNYPHALQMEYDFLAGNCHGVSSIENCDGDDPTVTGCSSDGYQLGGDVWYLRVYWSNHCSTNWASVTAPSGDLVTVTIARSPTKDWNNVDRQFTYCATDWTTCPADTWWTFGKYTTGWITDMLCAPSEAVAVHITTSDGGSYYSTWH